ncbi:MAG TPA: CRISPR-associated endonuclease Cas3'' [Methanoregulaceae archaeon]|nr:CRISPR-associated endonuclease Cas3'' [Methanoregulaceae archaeon]
MERSETEIRYFAHTTPDPTKQDWQPLSEHLENVAAIAGEQAAVFGAREWGEVAGRLHDLGKYSREFQSRLEGSPIRVDHSTAGAVEARTLLAYQSRPLEYIVAGHHGGLMDYGTPLDGLDHRLGAVDELPVYSAYRSEVVLPHRLSASPEIRTIFGAGPSSIAFWIRMLYSCLVDADSLDTERFASPERAAIRGTYDPTDLLATRFFHNAERLTALAAKTPINTLRQGIFAECLEMAEQPPGLFTLTVPTGGGKTLSSMAFALRHMQRHDLRQVVYVLPYTSIIEQNARVLRDIFGARNVLEHHSNFDPESDPEIDDSARSLSALVTENWDIPVVVTTNVQFFESLFSNRRSRCRKIHNLARSVIVLDEAQMLPTPFLKPCLDAVSELVTHYGATVVLCTATQPRVAGLMGGSLTPKEIVSAPGELYELFRRVIAIPLGAVGDDLLVSRLARHPQVLCILNRKAHARSLYEALNERRGRRRWRTVRIPRRRGWRARAGREAVFHLTANMCPVHRRKILSRIKHRLIHGSPCRVVATQLIEAGVDIDFPVVYRSMAGIDSIAQAAGRCNREGKLPTPGRVFVFRSIESHATVKGWLNRTAEIGEQVIGRHADPLSLDAVADYFDELYSIEKGGPHGFDEKEIMNLLHGSRQDPLAFPFKEVAEKFRLIQGTVDVIVPYDDEARRAIALLERGEISRRLLRRLQGYTVAVYPNVLKRLEDAGGIHRVGNRFIVLNNELSYSERTGLEVRNDGHYDLLLVDD